MHPDREASCMADNDVIAIDGAGAPVLDPEIRAAVRDIPDFAF